MPDAYQVITFDCYGDVDRLEGAAEPSRDRRPGGCDMLRRCASATRERPASRQREPTEATAASLAKRRTQDRRTILLATSIRPGELSRRELPRWHPLPIRPRARALASAGVKFGILSNVDDDLLAGTLKHFTVCSISWSPLNKCAPTSRPSSIFTRPANASKLPA